MINVACEEQRKWSPIQWQHETMILIMYISNCNQFAFLFELKVHLKPMQWERRENCFITTQSTWPIK